MSNARFFSITLLATVLVWGAGAYRFAVGQETLFRRADSNADGHRDISDPLYSLEYLFLGGPEPTCQKAADANDDGLLDIGDPVHTLMFLFLGTVVPLEPFPGCGADSTPDDLSCEFFEPCTAAPVYVNVQVDAEREDIDGLNRIISALLDRHISTTVYVTADYANRNALLVADLYTQGFEIALHGYYTGEQLATMTYEEQKDLLTRAKTAVEGCKPCGVYKPVVGFRPQYFSQNEDTFRVLDELGLVHNSGFKAHQIYMSGYEWCETPYMVEGHSFAAVPITTIPYGEDRAYLCDIACANLLEMTGEEWGAALLAGLNQSLETKEPLVVLLHGWHTGDTESFDYWQPFVDFLSAAEGKVTFVTTAELVDLYTQ